MEMDPLISKILLDRVAMLVAVCDAEFRITFVNREFLRFYECSFSHLAGELYPFVFNEPFGDYACILERLRAGEVVRQGAWHDHSHPGRRVFMEEVFSPFFQAGNGLSSIGIYCQDLTALKLREQELAQKVAELERSEALKSAIFDHTLAALISADERGIIVEFNPAAEAMFGCSRVQMVGRSVRELELSKPFLVSNWVDLEGTFGQRLQLRARRSDGTEFPIEMVLWRTQVGAEAFYTASIVDMTERHNAERQIEQHREALRQSEKLSMMGIVLAGVAHELNNPLTIAMGRASMLEEKCQNAALRADAQLIREATERCGRIVQMFLKMARQRPAQRSCVDLNELVEVATRMLDYTYYTHGIEMDKQLGEELPQIRADADQIGQVVMNLLVNAQQALAGRPGRRRVVVSTGLREVNAQQPASIWLRVSDNGPGIPAGLRSNIFEAFVSTKPEGAGTGLGLSIARSLAQAHGGELTLEDNPAEPGATFCLNLPISSQEKVR